MASSIQAGRGDTKSDPRQQDLVRMMTDESPFVQEILPDDNGGLTYTAWHHIQKPGEMAEMEDRMIFDRLALFAARVSDFDDYLSNRAESLAKAGVIEAAILVLSIRSAFRDLWAGPRTPGKER